MENKWTKGPWEFAAKAGYPVVFAGDRVMCSPGGYSIKDLREDHAKGEELVANAHLIAAAPELYESLKEIANHLYQPDLDLNRCRDLAKAAILKAEGK